MFVKMELFVCIVEVIMACLNELRLENDFLTKHLLFDVVKTIIKRP